jgi:putative membrane protein
MKKTVILCMTLAAGLMACNNQSADNKDSVEKADSTNQAKLDSTTPSQPTIATDQETTDFLVKAANGGMTEVKAAEIASTKSTNKAITDFAAMMKTDHGAANNEVIALAQKRNVTLPTSVGDDKQKELDDMAKMNGKDFDKDYVKAMVKGHEETVDMFKKASDKVKDSEVKTFIDNTLPTLQKHLDAIKKIQKNLK